MQIQSAAARLLRIRPAPRPRDNGGRIRRSVVGVTTAANTGVPADKAGLAAGLLSASQQLSMALGLAVLSAIATARTHDLLAAHSPRAEALMSGYQRGLLVCSIFVLAAALI